VVHDENAGLAATLNEGLERARYGLVARLDQDDSALSGRLRIQARFMTDHPNVVVAGSDVFHMGRTPQYDRHVVLPHSPRDVARALPLENCMYHPSVILRRDDVVRAGGYHAEFKNAEDYDLWLRLARTHDLANIAEPLIRYRFSLGGMTLSRKWEQLYYVMLAQEVNRWESRPFAEAEAAARARMHELDRRDFMRHVATGTATELVRLKLWSHALTVVRRFRGEVGPALFAQLVVMVASGRLGARAPERVAGV
jgi:glycosyltransferase involved in cell wall biosynthesis